MKLYWQTVCSDWCTFNRWRLRFRFVHDPPTRSGLGQVRCKFQVTDKAQPGKSPVRQSSAWEKSGATKLGLISPVRTFFQSIIQYIHWGKESRPPSKIEARHTPSHPRTATETSLISYFNSASPQKELGISLSYSSICEYKRSKHVNQAINWKFYHLCYTSDLW
jgi:hypothetical protein